MKVIGFTQLRNELEKGNLENWFRCMNTVCDSIYIYDQNSTDGSLDYYKQFTNVKVIESDRNRFDEELICKNELLDKVKKEETDVDFIFWMDGDTLLDGRLLYNDGKQFFDLCSDLKHDNYDAHSLGHKNLWRSDLYWRNDDLFNWLDENGVCALWKYTDSLTFYNEGGLHKQQYPLNIKKIKKLPYKLIHRGFSTDEQIITRYEEYKSRGQSGWALERLLKEETLEVFKLDKELLPEWFEVTDDVDPKSKKKIIDIYNGENK